MELQQLKYFQAIARLEHFTRAAQELYISQPSLSRSIARLEEELGAPLFDRQGRQVRLNALGKVFLARVEKVFDELEAGQRELQDMVGPERGQVALAFLHTVGMQLLPELVSAFRERYPHVTFRLSQNSASVMLNQLASGELDLCISSPVIEHPGVEWARLMTEELFLAVPTQHRLAGRDEIELNEAADEDFICLKPGYGMRDIADNLCHQAGFEPRVAFEGEEVATVRGLVAAGLGVALLPALAWQGLTNPTPVRLHITQPVCSREIGLAWCPGRYVSATARLFRDFIIANFSNL